MTDITMNYLSDCVDISLDFKSLQHYLMLKAKANKHKKAHTVLFKNFLCIYFVIMITLFHRWYIIISKTDNFVKMIFIKMKLVYIRVHSKLAGDGKMNSSLILHSLH